MEPEEYERAEAAQDGGTAVEQPGLPDADGRLVEWDGEEYR